MIALKAWAVFLSSVALVVLRSVLKHLIFFLILTPSYFIGYFLYEIAVKIQALACLMMGYKSTAMEFWKSFGVQTNFKDWRKYG